MFIFMRSDLSYEQINNKFEILNNRNFANIIVSKSINYSMCSFPLLYKLIKYLYIIL